MASFCLAYILLTEDSSKLSGILKHPQLYETIRGMAGLILKNLVKQKREASPEFIRCLKSLNLVSVLSNSPFNMVRSTISSLISTLIGVSPSRIIESDWPDLLHDLVGRAQTNLSVLDALRMAAEDHTEMLVHGYEYEACLLSRLFIQIICTGEGRFVKKAIEALNHMIPYQMRTIKESLFVLLEGLSKAGQDPSLKTGVCRALCYLSDLYLDEMQSFLPAILEYTFSVFNDSNSDKEAAMEATEFWLAMSERQLISPFVSQRQQFISEKVLPALFRNMKFFDDSQELVEQEYSFKEDLVDKDNEIMPRHHRSAASHNSKETGQIEEEQEEEESDGYEWNLRKCSAATVDCLSTCLDEQLFVPAVLPLIQGHLLSNDWKEVEVAILALGAIAEGCKDSLERHLPGLIPFLLEQQKTNPKPLVRSIATWTVSRFCWFFSQSGGNDVMEATLYGLISPNRLVQPASCTAIIKYIEVAPHNLVLPVLPAVFPAVKCALSTYGRKNLLCLYELIRSLFDELGETDLTSGAPSILSELLQNWAKLKPDDTAIFPLLEAIASIASTCGPFMAPYASEIFSRCLSMLQSTLSQDPDDVDYDIAIVSIELIGATLVGLGTQLVLSQDVVCSLLSVMDRALFDPLTDLRQSVFGLIGDLIQSQRSALLLPLSERLNLAILQDFQPTEDVSAANANNAVWVAGLLAVDQPSVTAPISTKLLAALVKILESEQLFQRSNYFGYLENVVIATGRLITISPIDTLSGFPLLVFCQQAGQIGDAIERESCLYPVLLQIRDRHQMLQGEQRDAVRSLLYQLMARTDSNSSFADLVRTIASLIEL